MEFQIPRIVHEDADDHRGVFAIEPLDRGFGHTFGTRFVACCSPRWRVLP